jgi:hypothetical protein
MGTFKNICIWVTWKIWKHQWIEILIFILAGVFLTLCIITPDVLGLHYFTLRWGLITIGALILFVAIYWLPHKYLARDKNFRRAIDEGTAILKQEFIRSDVLLYLIELTEKTKDPSLLSDWITDWHRLQNLLKDSAEMRTKLEILPDQLRIAELTITELSAKLKERQIV